MKKILTLLVVLLSINLFAQDVLFEENFSYVMDTWYGDLVLEEDEYDLYFDNEGWTGENVVLGSPSATGEIPFNDVNKPRVSFWRGATDHLTTPIINCGNTGVTFQFKLKLTSRSNTGNTFDYNQVNILHAPDGEDFELLETIVIPKNTLEDPLSFTDFSMDVTNATANSKFRFQVTQNNDPNRFFVDAVIVKQMPESGIEMNILEGNIKISSSEVIVRDGFSFSELAIFNLLGERVHKGKENRLDISNLSSGIYILQLSSINGVGSIKFIKD